MEKVGIQINRGRGATPEELAERAAAKVINLADVTGQPDSVRDQARGFQKRLQGLMVSLARQAAHNDRATVYNAIKDAGYPELAQHIMRL